MGSGSSRKQNDKPIIKKPKVKVVNSGGSGSEGGGRHSSEGVAACPPGFSVRIPDGQARNGDKLILKAVGDTVKIFLTGKEIAKLSRSKSIQISNCIKAGFRYPGVARKKTDGLYGEFTRES